MSPPRSELPKDLKAALWKNRARRERAAAELEAAREELQELLVRGERGQIAEMARVAGVSRETAHKLLREAGRPVPASRRGKREAKDDA